MFLLLMGLMMGQLAKFEAVNSVQDLEELRALALEAVALAKQAMAERDNWQQRYQHRSNDLVEIREVTLDELARMVKPRE